MANPITQTQSQDQTTVARISGSITVMNAPDLRIGLIQIINQQQPKVLAVNLAEVDFIDSSGLGVFVEARRLMADNGGSITFTNVNPDVRGLMRIMNLEALFGFVDDEAQLLTASE